MISFRPLLLLGLLVGWNAAALGAEKNVWPFWVGQTADDGSNRVQSWTAAGPLFFYHSTSPAGQPITEGFRPLYVRRHNPDDSHQAGDEIYVLYPIFSLRRSEDGYRWSFYSLINHFGPKKTSSPAGAMPDPDRGLDVWPFYFSRQTGSPDTSYRAVFPIAGKVYGRFGDDRMSWFLFPLYGRFEKRGTTTVTAPWPFVRVMSGEGNHGFAFWPLFGWRGKSDSYHSQFYLWPLIYKNESQLWETQPDVKFGFLPFYARETSRDVNSETYLWPFFGYTDRVAPYRYHQSDYFWPFFVQGRGDNRYVNRWGPFYTHSIIKGTDKTWYAWPLLRRESHPEGKLTETTTELFYFVYRRTVQRSATNPDIPAASKTHVWPLLTIWDNGAGHKQVQALSPLEVFFPSNEIVRLSYSPLFALYRYDRQASGNLRYSVLWDFVTYRREPDHKEFHIGPLFSSETRGSEKRVAFGHGLFGARRADGGGWKFFVFDFKRRSSSGGAQP